MIIFFAENPSTLINGISLSNQNIYNLFRLKQKVLWIEEFGQRKKIREMLSLFKIFISVISIKKIKYFYCVLPTSTIGLLKIFIILKIINILNNKIKFLLHIHRGDLIKNIKKNKIFKLLISKIIKNYKRIHAIFVISEKLKNDLDKLLKKKIKVLVKRNGPSFLYNIKSKKIKKTTKKIKLIYLSNVIKSKGILRLCKDISKLKYHKLYELHIYGNILDLSSKNFFQNNKFKNINLKNPLKNNQLKFEILKRYDALVLPSKNEGDPLCIIEAMSVGLPAICYNVGYISETIGKNYDLYLNKNSLTKIYKKLSNKNYRKKISNYVLKKFNERKKSIKLSNDMINRHLLSNKKI